MADFDLSMAITADGGQAVSELGKVEGGVLRTDAAAVKAAGGWKQWEAATLAAARAGKATAAAATQGAGSIDRLAASSQRATQAARAHTVSLGQQRAAYVNLGQQVQDITMGLSMGINPLTILAQQGGQTAFALSQMGGTMGRVAAFMAGPWGSIIIASIALLGMFAMRSGEAAKAQEDLGDMADYVGRAQSQLGKIFDLTTGKLTNQNVVMREAIRLQAILAQQTAMKEGRAAGQRLAAAGRTPVVPGPGGGPIAGAVGIYRQLFGTAIPAEYRQLVDEFRSNANASVKDFRTSLESMAKAGKLEGIDINAALKDALELAAARGDVQANRDIQRMIDGEIPLPDYLRKAGKTPKAKKGPKPKDMSGLEEFGEDAAKRIRSIAAAFSDIPPQQEKVTRALAEMDDLLDDVARKKPPGFEKLIEDGERAKEVIRDGINEPYRKFLESQEKSLDIARLIAVGRHDEAQALQHIHQLEASMGPLSEARKDAILASVQALRAEQREAEKLNAIINRQLSAVQEIKDAIRGIFMPGGLRDLPGRLMGAVQNYLADTLFDKLFGGIFQSIEDQVTGTTIVEEAAETFRSAIEEEANPSLSNLAEAAEAASAALGRVAAAPSGGGAGEGEPYDPAEGEIVVTGTRIPKRIPTDPAGFFAHIAEQLAKGVLGEKFAKTIGQLIGQALEGAAIGQTVAGTLFGEQGGGAKIGSSIGGAIGNVAGTAIGKMIGGTLGSFMGPIGSALGGIAGSLLGGLIGGGKAPSGGTQITNVYEQGTYSGSQGLRNDVNALASSIQGGLLEIANALGGAVGNFNVSVGKYDGDWRVNTMGLTGKALRAGSPGTFDFNDDQAAAIAFAVADAIKDGAIIGLSSAVMKALQSSEDINRAIREAMKVQELEILIGGMGSMLEQQFRAFELQAAERVRLAKTYGLDLLKVEELNARERAELLDRILQERIGALQDFLDELNFGAYFAGTLMEQRTALQKEIRQAQADVAAGVEGAADRLADLNRQLLDVSLEAYGTAGPEYAADLAAARKAAEDAIALETARAREAQERAIAQLTAAQTSVDLQNETNNWLSQIYGALSGSGTGTGTASPGTSPSYSGVGVSSGAIGDSGGPTSTVVHL